MKNKSVNKLSSSELSYFCSQIAMILKSGMLIYDGIEWMHKEMEEGNVKNVLSMMLDELSNKIPLYKAMENTNLFPNYMVSMSQIGSMTGSLEEVMISLSDYYERENFLKSKIRNSIFYPFMLFLMMSFVIIILVTKIFPIFQGMVQELGGTDQSLISFSTGIAIGNFLLVLVIVVLVLIVATFIFYKTNKGKLSLNSLLHNFILTKPILKKITAYRFASSMSLLLSSGMNIESSTNMLLDIVEEPVLKSKIQECSKLMGEGKEFIESISNLSLFSGMHLQMLNMGQRTGEMDIVMKKLTDIYEIEANQSIESSVSLIEPILIGTLCLVIGFILISVMLPLMNIMSSIS